ncbi:ferritin family protein [Aerosakkonema funiforme]|uniref:rubrerythrin family protein n=1 Tax=Oscillatoriophycideae TaxID=1301283 RepID=UPI002AC858B8|nr:ferritin family protein [Aerosakkonema funiforme]
MNRCLNLSQISQKTFILLVTATVAALSLTSCKQEQPPVAIVETTSPVAQTVSNEESLSLKNLQAAYNGESNAHARYVAFAQKAKEEGYLQVASLFKAAATAEAIHAANHAAVIRKLGATPEAKIEKLEVKSTQENLEAAIKGESYERDTMYPQFIEQARKENNKDAEQTFEYAVEAEKEHAKFYTQAKDNLKDWKEAKKVFYVCPECGYTTDLLNFANCPECNSAKDLFLEIV